MMEKMNSAGSVKIFDAVVAAARPRRAVGLPVSLASAFAALKDASAAFSGGARLSGGAPVVSVRRNTSTGFAAAEA